MRVIQRASIAVRQGRWRGVAVCDVKFLTSRISSSPARSWRKPSGGLLRLIRDADHQNYVSKDAAPPRECRCVPVRITPCRHLVECLVWWHFSLHAMSADDLGHVRCNHELDSGLLRKASRMLFPQIKYYSIPRRTDLAGFEDKRSFLGPTCTSKPNTPILPTARRRPFTKKHSPGHPQIAHP